MICICEDSPLFPRCVKELNTCEREDQKAGYGYDELKDFDMGYRDPKQNRITPFRGSIR